MGISGGWPEIESLPFAIQDAKQALQYADFFEMDFCNIAEFHILNQAPIELLQVSNELAFHLRTLQEQSALNLVRKALSLMKSSNLSVDLFTHECLKLVYLALYVCQESGKEFTCENQKPFIPNEQLQKIKNSNQLCEWILCFYKNILFWLKEVRTIDYAQVFQAKEYIDQHYSEPLTLPFLSEMCHMQPTYFSVRFKEQIGSSYIKYINYVRLENAKIFLLQKKSIKEVCALTGFNSYRYFCDKFKAYYGITPNQYRTQMKNMKK